MISWEQRYWPSDMVRRHNDGTVIPFAWGTIEWCVSVGFIACLEDAHKTVVVDEPMIVITYITT
jgi:hypothetical protein